MTEVLFILTTIFVAYVVYVVIGEKQAAIKSANPKATQEAQAPISGAPKPRIIEKEAPVAAVKVAEKSAVASAAKGAVRDPKTGEVTTIANNYRFTKRWIKEALVAEGLLEKIYKNNELNESTEAVIKQALIKFEAMDKYRA